MLLALMLVAGCNRGVILHPELSDSTTGTVTFDLSIGGRLQFEGFSPFSNVSGERALTVQDGVLVEKTTSLRVSHKTADGEIVWESTATEPPAAPLAAEVARFWGVERRSTIGDRGLSTELGDVSTQPGADAADLAGLMQGVLAAPPGRHDVGACWFVELSPASAPGADDGRYRSWCVTSVTDKVAIVEEENRIGDPFTGELPDERGQRRSMTSVDGRTGRPIEYRLRDLGSKLVGVDVEARFTWE